MINQRSEELLAKLDVHIDVTKTLDNYSVALQQMIAIARAVDVDARILILDEPTSSLDETETAHLFKIMRHCSSRGSASFLFRIFWDRFMRSATMLLFLRNGELVGSYPTAGLSQLELIARMVGKNLNDVKDMDKFAEKSQPAEEVFLDAKGIGAVGKISEVDVTIHAVRSLVWLGCSARDGRRRLSCFSVSARSTRERFLFTASRLISEIQWMP